MAAESEFIRFSAEKLEQLCGRIEDCLGRLSYDQVWMRNSGNENAVLKAFEPLRPGGCVVFIGMPVKPVPVDVVAAQAKEARIETIFRYANVYPRAINLMESGKINVKPMITDKYKFADSIRAFEYAANPKPTSVKVAIEM